MGESDASAPVRLNPATLRRCPRTALCQSPSSPPNAMEKPCVSQHLELLANFVFYVLVLGVESLKLFAARVHVLIREFGRIQPLRNVQNVQRPSTLRRDNLL